MMSLDTHALVWWLSRNSQLSTRARRLIDKESKTPDNLCVSSVSIWEIAMLVAKGRLVLRVNLEDWIAQAERVEAIQFVPVNNRIALRATQLPEPLHKDPADRIIIATTMELGCRLVTGDRKITAYPQVETVW